MAVTITTFFSYKGGAGRSTTCLNSIPLLALCCNADSEHPVLLLDTDIDSAGMTYLLDQQNHFGETDHDVKGFLSNKENLFTTSHSSSIKDDHFYKWFVPVGNKLGLKQNDAVMFLGVNDRSTVNKDSIVASRAQAMKFLRDFANKYIISHVVLDSAAGDQESAKLSILQSNKIVFCMRPTRQFRTGTFRYLSALNRESGKTSRKKEIILLPTVIPADAVINGESQIEAAVTDINNRCKKLDNLFIQKEFVENKSRFGINEVTRFKWQEGVLYQLNEQAKQENRALSADEVKALDRYRKLARLIDE